MMCRFILILVGIALFAISTSFLFTSSVQSAGKPWGASARWCGENETGMSLCGSWKLIPASHTRGKTTWGQNSICRQVAVRLKYSKNNVLVSGQCDGESLIVTIRRGAKSAGFANNKWNLFLSGLKTR